MRRGPFAIALLACALLLDAASAVAAPGWISPADLSAPGKEAFNPSVAMDDAGGTVVVWERQMVISHSVQVSTRSPGGPFSSPADLSLQAQNPEVAMTPGGEAIAVWWHFQNPPGNYVLQASTRPPGGSFSSPVDVTSLPSGVIPSSIQLGMNGSGDVALAWTRRDPGSAIDPSVTFVEASVRPAGGAFSPAATVSPLPLVAGQSASSPRLAIDGDGEVTVVWSYDEGPDETIQVATRPPGGEFSPPEPISEAGEDAFSPDVAVDSAGTAIAVWSRSEGEDTIAQGSVRPPGGEFSSPADDLSAEGGDALGPAVGMTPGGAATVAWTLSEESGLTVQVAEWPAGGSFSAPEGISTAGESPLFPSLAVGSGGDALIAWSGASGTAQVARASVRPAGGGFGSPVEISATSADLFHPEGAIGIAGDATAVWTRSNGSDDIVQAAGYDADPPELRGVSIPASGTVGVPVAFSASPFDVWPISSTGFSFGDSGTAGGSSVSHVYSSPGTFLVTVTATGASGSPTSATGTIAISPSYEFRIAKRKRNQKRGVVTLTIAVPGPGRVAVFGGDVKKREKRARSAGQVSLPVLTKGKALQRLLEEGKARVSVSVSFAPDGGDHTARRRVLVVLVKKLQPLGRPHK